MLAQVDFKELCVQMSSYKDICSTINKNKTYLTTKCVCFYVCSTILSAVACVKAVSCLNKTGLQVVTMKQRQALNVV